VVPVWAAFGSGGARLFGRGSPGGKIRSPPRGGLYKKRLLSDYLQVAPVDSLGRSGSISSEEKFR
jgi:hypothetical protein